MSSCVHYNFVSSVALSIYSIKYSPVAHADCGCVCYQHEERRREGSSARRATELVKSPLWEIDRAKSRSVTAGKLWQDLERGLGS